MNREQRRRMERAGIPAPEIGPRPGPSGPDLIMPAMLAAATSSCTCRSCKILRRAAAEISELALEEEEHGESDQDPR
jgi:hypothetical protein